MREYTSMTKLEETDGPDVAVTASTAWPSLLQRLDRLGDELTEDAMSFLNKGSLLALLKNPVVKGLSTLDRDRKLIQQLAEIDLLHSHGHGTPGE
jgi:hypothetical protein